MTEFEACKELFEGEVQIEAEQEGLDPKADRIKIKFNTERNQWECMAVYELECKEISIVRAYTPETIKLITQHFSKTPNKKS